MASNTAERIAKIVEAAEKAASAVIDDAEAQARRYLEDAQAEADRIVAERLSSLSQLSDSLVAQAEAIRRQSDRLLATLGDTDPVATPSAPVAAPEPPAPTPHLSAVEPEPTPAAEQVVEAPPAPPAPTSVPDLGPPPTVEGTPAAARLLATQMAVSGASREEIEIRLRAGFEIDDAAPILDAILGPEG